jgi:hypothetical protein
LVLAFLIEYKYVDQQKCIDVLNTSAPEISINCAQAYPGLDGCQPFPEGQSLFTLLRDFIR